MKRTERAHSSAVTLVAMVCFVVASYQPASATVTSFSDEATWQAAMTGLGGFTLHNFDSFTLDDAGTVFGQPHETLTTDIAGITFSNAEIIPSCCGGGVRSSPNVVLNFPDSKFTGDIVIEFDAPVLGVGLFNASVVDGATLEIFDSSDVSISSLVAPIDSVNFGGFTVDSAMGIKKLVVSPGPGGNGSIFIDDLQVGVAVTSVPEPTTLALFGLSLAGFAAASRRRKR